jgi:hypothetical protein
MPLGNRIACCIRSRKVVPSAYLVPMLLSRFHAEPLSFVLLGSIVPEVPMQTHYCNVKVTNVLELRSRVGTSD